MRYQVRELKLGEILDQAVALTKNHFGLLLSITAVLQIPFGLLQGFVGNALLPAQPVNPSPAETVAYQQAAFQTLFVTAPLILVYIYIVVPITNAATVYAIANAYLEKPITTGQAFKHALRRIGGLLWTWLVFGLAVMGGLMLCIVPGILAAFWFALSTQIVVVEGISGIPALKRSMALVRGSLGTMIMLGLIVGIINYAIAFGAALIPQAHLQTITSVLVTSITSIFSAAAFVVFYFSCRCRFEQFDLALLAQSVAAESPMEAADAPQ